MIALLLAAAHLYVLPWKTLLLLPAPSAQACGITSVRYGPPDGKWERGVNAQPDCQFRVSVAPGPLLPIWVDNGPAAPDLSVTFTAQGEEAPRTLDLKPEPLEPAAAPAGALGAHAQKVKNNVRVEVKNGGAAPLLLGDAVALRGHPRDPCLGPGPAAAVAPGETLVDERPGLLSPSMKIWVAVFTGEKACRWVEARRR